MRFEGRRAALFSLSSLALSPLARCGPTPARVRIRGGWDVQVRSEAMDTARELVGGRCGLLIDVERVRHLDAAERLCSLGHWRALSEKLDIDPLNDIARAFVTSSRFDDISGSAIVLELARDDADNTAAALASLDKDARPGVPFATELEGTDCLVVSPRPGMIVSVPATAKDGVSKFNAASALPPAKEDEAVVAFAEAPAETLGKSFAWPTSVREMRARIGLSPWGATLDVFATSDSPAQAEADAATLTAALDSLLRLDLFLFEVNLLPKAEFVARGDRMDLATDLGRAEVEILLALGSL